VEALTLAEFLKARLAEDEDYCRTMFEVVKRQDVRAAAMSDSELGKLAPALMDLLAAEPVIPELSQQWAARGTKPPNDLHRVLREVEAKRAILAEHAIDASRIRTYPFDPFTGKANMVGSEVNCAVCGWASIDPTSGCRTLRLLAATWSDHPDYDPGWAP
jgi:hypothetical protein